MYRKVLRFLAVTLVLSLLAIMGEFTVLASVRAPAQPLLAAAGASPQAPGDQFRPTTAADGPSRLASCHGAAEWARPTGRVLASAVTVRKVNLGQVIILGQALVRGGYANRTAPTGFESVLNGVRLPTWGEAPTVLLAVIMVLVIVLVARRSGPVAEEAIAAAARAPRADVWHVAGRQRLQRAWLILRALALVDRAADWERVRLVPT